MINPALPLYTIRNKLRKSGVNRLPAWFKQEIIDDRVSRRTEFLSVSGINTVCRQAKCPNMSRCFKDKQVTFMILGATCTRSCRFCAVDKAQDECMPLDRQEPYRVAEAVKKLALKYAVITSVTRDDLADGGAEVFVKTIELIRDINKDIGIEVLIPDFCGNLNSLSKILTAGPSVLAHNMETIERLYPVLRPQADYRRSLGLLQKAKAMHPDLLTKTSLMLGLGEREEEIIEALREVRFGSVDIVTLGQYLAPSPAHYPVKEFITPEQFERYRKIGLDLGFKAVASGPLVRSSYQAERAYKETLCTI